MNIAALPASLSGVSDAEWKVRCDLAALYRLVAHHRMTDLIYTHISARLPGPEHHFLINKYGVMFHEMRAVGPGEDRSTTATSSRTNGQQLAAA